MFPTATIVFREVLEVSLVLCVIMAATRGLPHRLSLAMTGIGIGIIGAIAISLFTNTISEAIDGVGQEVFNASIMFIAVGFLGWTVVWMKYRGRNLARHLKTIGQDITNGDKSSYLLIGVIALGTFREGAEIALFTYGLVASNAFPVANIIAGGLMGLAGGALVGFMLYMGLLKAAQRHLFTITSWMLIVLTAGIAAQGASFLIAAGFLPELYSQVWDTSSIISGQSFIGQTLGVLIGYTPRPTGMELAFYASTLIIIASAYKMISPIPPSTLKT